MASIRLAYVNVFVKDFDAAVAFYRDTLGLPQRMADPAFGFATFALGELTLGVARVEETEVRQGGLAGRHTGIGLAVTDLDAAHAELVARGVAFTMPPTKQAWGGYMALLSDPEGNIFYLDQL
ncbi:MAG: VOC family protein [Dehalococcoidia bacterium]